MRLALFRALFIPVLLVAAPALAGPDARITPVIRHTAPSEIEAMKGVLLRFEIRGLRVDDRVKLMYRLGEELLFYSLDLSIPPGETTHVGKLPPSLFPLSGRYTFDYYLVITDARGAEVAALRSPDDPISLPVTLPPANVIAYEKASDLYKSARFFEALRAAEALRQSQLPPELAARTQLLIAMIYVAMGDNDNATRAFQGLLDLDPNLELPEYTTPSVRSLFDKVKREYRKALVIKHQPPSGVEAINGLVLGFDVGNTQPGDRVKLMYRIGEELLFYTMELSKPADAASPQAYIASLPTSMFPATGRYTFDYYLQVTDAKGGEVGGLRGPDDPFSVPVSAPPPVVTQPLHKKWWFWTLIVGAAAASAVGVGVGVGVGGRPATLTRGSATVVFE
ncbi:MAG: hypothetical protein IT381_21810 [Deltaproteobacteria bacterium]|nr:hypothetical protein [Deltaproteobacteria bacterium]